MIKKSLNKKIKIIGRLAVLLVACVIIVISLPKSQNFNYEYQLGTTWKYENLRVPFDFPVYKMDSELEKEKEDIKRSQLPIYNLNKEIGTTQVNKFVNEATKLVPPTEEGEEDKHATSIRAIRRKLAGIYHAGILQSFEKLLESKTSTVKIIENNVGRDVEVKSIYSLKSAYTALHDYTLSLHLPDSIEDVILPILDRYITTNLEFDESKTNSILSTQLQNISLTQGMIHKGEEVIKQDEIITPEKFNILNSLKKEYRNNNAVVGNRVLTITGLSLLTLAGLLVCSLYFYFFLDRSSSSYRSFILIFGSFLATVLLGSISYHYDISIIAIPTLLLIIVTNILINKQAALYLLLSTSMILSYFAIDSYMYLFMQIAAGVVAIFSLSHLQRRGQLFFSILLIFITYSLIFFAFIILRESTFTWRHAMGFVFLVTNSILLCLSYFIIYLFERLFGFVSDITLIELSNPNHPALRDLTHKAPGTFQHSLMVANLAEEAIYRIGGNPLLVRTGALYHDIGKAQEPIYFIENQAGGVNPHASLGFDESAQHIINHVTHGIILAKKHNIPEAVVDFIRTHHGRSKAKFFYNSFKNKYPDKEIDESIFTYPGPDPSSKECAVLMMADSVEAAIRSLEEKTEANITARVNSIIDNQLSDKRFEQADITFREISITKQIFISTLANIYHSRISYPELKK
ncbi:HDIG domain-containing protein [Bacteroidia bacterium]|nr:HDIG domain-containing protein [Bacteroidia bacterium]